MQNKLFGRLSVLWQVEKHERAKLLYLMLAFFLIIMSYTIARELKDVIFASVVGAEYVPWAKQAAIIALVPAILIYSYLVNKMRRYHLLAFCCTLFGLIGLLFAWLIGDPRVGMANTDTGSMRLLWWFFYFFVEGYAPFVVSVAWAFANSIYSPSDAREGYAFLVAGSRTGGVVGAGFGWYFFSHSFMFGYDCSPILKSQLLLAISSLLLLAVPIVLFIFIKRVPGRYLHGYEAAYDFQKESQKNKAQPGVFSGLVLLLRNPYVMGIFSMIFFYEIINVVLSYQRIVVAQAGCELSVFAGRLFSLAFSYQLVGILVALFGTNALLRLLGERRCLVFIPLAVGALLGLYLMLGSFAALWFVFIGIRALNYGFFYPVRESLYIPTVKVIKFQSKAWIDSFGTKFAKAIGSQANMSVGQISATFGAHVANTALGAIFACVLGVWTIVAWAMGSRYAKAIENNEVIGAAQAPGNAEQE